jgi:hypothetical protein
MDDNWIHEFEENDKLYKDFYKDDLYFVKLKFIYLDAEHNINKIKDESYLLMNPNFISREEMIQILKTNCIDNSKKYSLFAILKFNFTLNADEMHKYIMNKDDHDYLSIIKNINTIYFEKSISMFQDLNEVIFIFHEKSVDQSLTKKVYFRHTITTRNKTIKKTI